MSKRLKISAAAGRARRGPFGCMDGVSYGSLQSRLRANGAKRRVGGISLRASDVSTLGASCSLTCTALVVDSLGHGIATAVQPRFGDFDAPDHL